MPPFRSPPRGPSRQLLAENVTATVKWFNAEKGFGFVTPSDGGQDIFLHVSALSATGADSVPDGATLTCDISQGQKGPQVATVHEIDLSTATASAPRGRSGGERRPPSGDRGGYGGGDSYRQDSYQRDSYDSGGGSDEVQSGVVKFFDASRGFGFIKPANGNRDVFVHASALTRAGLPLPNEGQPVRFTTRPGKKGEEVSEIEFD